VCHLVLRRHLLHRAQAHPRKYHLRVVADGRRAPLSQSEIVGIAASIVALIKPDLVAAVTSARVPPPVAHAAPDGSAASSGGRSVAAAALVTSASRAPVSEVETAVRGCFHAFEERIVKLETMGDSVVTQLTKNFDASLKRFLHERPVTQMSDNELITALKKAFPTPTIRKAHAHVLNNVMLSFVDDEPNEKGDTVTESFPPASSLLQKFPNTNFKKICLCVAERLLQANAKKPLEQQPHVICGKSGVQPDSMDRVDHATDTIIRATFHDPRCWARKLLYMLFAYFLIKDWTTMELTEPDASRPSANDGNDADYFAITATLTASCSGIIAVDGVPAPEHKADPGPGSLLAGDHTVTRKGNLYKISEMVLQAVVRATHKFEKRVVFSFALTLRGLLVSPDR